MMQTPFPCLLLPEGGTCRAEAWAKAETID